MIVEGQSDALPVMSSGNELHFQLDRWLEFVYGREANDDIKLCIIDIEKVKWDLIRVASIVRDQMNNEKIYSVYIGNNYFHLKMIYVYYQISRWLRG